MRAAERVARESYGRLVAILASRSFDLAASEDALSEALVAALEAWPRDGVPASPEGWLLTAARRRLLDQRRRAVVRTRTADTVAMVVDELVRSVDLDQGIPDERLRLLFVCTHPALAHDVQVPLMLQSVLGLDASQIASAMCVAPKTMGQRLWRAKTKIAESAIPFEVPGRGELADRVDAVLEAIYAAYGTAWDDVRGADVRLAGVTEEAIFLCRLLRDLLPHEPEVSGLLALVLFAEARRPARRSDDGALKPLSEQDVSRWNVGLVAEAEAELAHAFRMGSIGPFQLEAAIQSAHVVGRRRGRVDHEAVLVLYDGLLALAPSIGASVGRAAALLEARGPAAALEALDDPLVAFARSYQPAWAVRGEALFRMGRTAEAERAFSQALGLSSDPAVRAYLLARATEAGRR